MKITWLVDEVEGNWSDGFSSIRASNRYRAIVPARELRRLGHDVQLQPMADWRPRADDAAPDVLIVGKQFGWNDVARYSEVAARQLEGVKALTARGTRVVADFCDDHFAHPLLGPNLRALAGAADICVAASDGLRSAVQPHARTAVVVGDPICSPAVPPRVFRTRSRLQSWVQSWGSKHSAGQRLRMVWYGNLVNVDPVFGWADRLTRLGARPAWALSVVTKPTPGVERAISEFNARYRRIGEIELVPWSEEAQWATVAAADLVLIPADLDNPAKRAKSANRLTDALHMGRFAIASPVPEYLPYRAHAALTDDPVEAVRAYLSDPDAALAAARAGQQAALERAAPAVIGQAWLDVLMQPRSLTAATANLPAGTPGPAAQAAATAGPVRLNLGCGDKILPGYINVDVVEARAGKSPDVICDLHDLEPFPDNYADEVLAVHVVEHFWRWEIDAVIREWIRVLKPGGRMVLECPNLQAACEAFLANPEVGSRQDRAGQRTMWVFYGDPQWKDPLMVHRWGYTPKSLAALMEANGLVHARQEPAQYKLREPRDMRVVAEKPLRP